MKSAKQITDNQTTAGESATTRTTRPMWQRALASVLIVTLELAPIKVSFDGIMGLRFGWSEAHADGPIADPYAAVQFQPKITQSSAGVPVVNITAPNAGGISLNRYQQFNIDAAGLILNNSMVGGGTLLGGDVAGNFNLNGRSANLIVNEVTSSGGAFTSQLNGGIEVFGAPAHVIIANPNGINCTGCAFVNTPRITLTTGAVELLSGRNGSPTAFANAAALAYAVSSGHVGVSGIGIEGTTGQMDIIAETMTIDAALRANLGSGSNSEITLIAGRNRVAEDARGVYVVAPSTTNNTAAAVQGANSQMHSVQNGYAIDASALGAMTAGQIRIIATTDGLGVKTDGALAATAGALSIDSNGQIRVGNTFARRDVALTAKGNLEVSGKLVGTSGATLTSGANLTVASALETNGQLLANSAHNASFSGSVLAAQDVSVLAGGTLSQLDQFTIGGRYDARAGDISALGVTRADAGISLESSGTVTFTNLVTERSLTLNAQGDITGTGDSVALTGMNIGSTAGSIHNQGSLASGADLSLRAHRDVIVGGDVSSTGDSELSAGGTLSLTGTLGVGADASLRAQSTLSIAGRTDVAGNVSLATQTGDLIVLGDITANTINAAINRNIDTRGNLLAVSGANLQAGENLVTAGNIAVGGNLRQLAGADVINGAITLTFGEMHIAAGRDASFNGALGTGGNLTVLAQRNVHANALVQVGGNANVSAVSGSIAAIGNVNVGGAAQLSAVDEVATAGVLESGARLDIQAGGLATLGGALLSGSAMNVTAQSLTSSGTVTAMGEASLATSGGSLVTNGDVRAVGNIELRSAGDIRAGGGVSSGSSATLSAQQDIEVGNVSAVRSIALNSSAGSVNAHGALLAGAEINVVAKSSIAATGAINSLGNVSLRADNGKLVTSGALSSGASLAASAGGDVSMQENISALERVNVNAGVGITTRSIAAGDTVTLRAGGPLEAQGSLSAANGISVQAQSVALAGAISNADVNAIAVNSLWLRGGVVARGDVNLQAGGTLINESGASAGRDLTVSGGSLTNSASLFASGASNVAVGDLTNRGSIYGTSNTISARDIDNNSGSLLGATQLSIDASNLASNANGSFISGGDLRLALTGALDNAGGRIVANRDLSLKVGGLFDPSAAASGTISTGNLLTIEARALANSGNWTPNASGLALTTFGDFSNAGIIELAGDFRIATSGNISNSGEIKTGGTIALAGAGVSNTNLLKADKNVELSGNVGNHGTIAAGQDIVVTGSAFDNGRGTAHASRDMRLNVTGIVNNVGGTLSASNDITVKAAALNNDREAPTTTTVRSADYAASQLAPIILSQAESVTTCDAHVTGSCMTQILPEITIADLTPDYLAGTVTRSYYTLQHKKTPLVEQVALPVYETTRTTQANGAESRITAGANLSITLDGELANRGSVIEAGGDVSIRANSLQNGRSATLSQRYQGAVNQLQLEQFIDDLNRTQNYFGGRIYELPTLSPVDTIILEKGVAGSIRSGASSSLDFANLTNAGTILAADDVSLKTSGVFSNIGEHDFDIQTTVVRRGSDTAPLIVPVIDANGNVSERQVIDGFAPFGVRKNVTYFTQQASGIQTPATIAAGGRLAIQGADVRNTHAQLLAQGNLTVRAATGLHNVAGTIESRDGDINIDAASVSNSRGDTAWVGAWQEIFQGVDSGHNEEDFFEVIKQVETTPAGIVSAARDVSIVTGALSNQGALLNAGRNLSVDASGSVNNTARERSVKYVHSQVTSDGRVWDWAAGDNEDQFGTYATGMPENTPSTIQAGSSLSIKSGGTLINSGNVLGQQVSLSGSAITNGLTDYNTQTPAPTTPNRLISLASVNLGVGITNAQSSLATASATQAASVVVNAPVLNSTGIGAVQGPVKLSGAAPRPAAIDTSAARRLVDQLPEAPTPIEYGTAPRANAVGDKLEATPSAASNIRYLNTNAATGVLNPLSAEYLLSLLPARLVQGKDLLFFADPYVEQQLLRQAALTEVGRNYFINGLAFDDRNKVSIDAQQQAILYANAAEFAAANNVSLGVALTAEQQNALDRPLLWYVEQKIKQRDGSELAALVPTVYLPQIYSDQNRNLAGGLIQADSVTLVTAGTLRNTGYIVGNEVSLSAAKFINQKRLADIGTRTQRPNDEGYFKISGEAVQAGGFLSAANLALSAERVQSIGGEFQLLAGTQEQSQANTENLLARLRGDLGVNFSESDVADNLRQEWVQTKDHEFEQIAMAVASIVVSALTYGAGAELVGLSAAANPGLTAAANAAYSSMASSVVTGAINGDLSFENVLKAGLTSGLTAGYTQSLGLNNLGANAGFGDQLINWGGRSFVSAGVNTAMSGGSFQTAFVSSFVSSAAAGAANWIGDHSGMGQVLGEFGGVGHVLAHAALGCAAAAATDQDCSSGAVGAATSAFLTSFLDAPTDANGNARSWTSAERALITAGSSLVGALVADSAGLESSAALNAASNEVQNNYLNHAQMAAFQKEFNQCAAADAQCQQRVWAKWKATSDEQDKKLLGCADEWQCEALAEQAKSGAGFNLNLRGANSQVIKDYLRFDNQAAYLNGEIRSNGFAGLTLSKRVAGGGLGVLQAGLDTVKGVVSGAVDATKLIGAGYGQIANLIVGETVFESAQARSEAAANVVANIDKLPAAIKNQISATWTEADRLEASGETVRAAQLRANLVANISAAVITGGETAVASGRRMIRSGRALIDRLDDARIDQAAIERAKVSNNFYADGSAIDFPRELQTSSGVMIRANPDRTTTVLGSFRSDTDRIMQSLDYQQSTVISGPAAPGSFNILNVPDGIATKLGSERFWNEVNKPFLDAAINRGDDIALATKPDDRYIFKADGSLTFFGREIQYLESKGFIYNAVSGTMNRVGGMK